MRLSVVLSLPLFASSSSSRYRVHRETIRSFSNGKDSHEVREVEDKKEHRDPGEDPIISHTGSITTKHCDGVSCHSESVPLSHEVNLIAGVGDQQRSNRATTISDNPPGHGRVSSHPNSDEID